MTQFWQVTPLDKGSYLVRYDDPDQPALVERTWPGTKGKALLLTTPMDDAKQEWNKYSSSVNPTFYLGLTLLSARYLCAEPENPTLNFVFGKQLPVVDKSPVAKFPKYLLTGNGVSEEITFDKDRWTGVRLPHEGNYAVTGVDGEKEEKLGQFSINIAGEESDLSRVPMSEVEALLGKDAVVPQDRKTALLDTLKDRMDEPMELFPWLMLLFLFFLALENLLANKFYRPDPVA